MNPLSHLSLLIAMYHLCIIIYNSMVCIPFIEEQIFKFKRDFSLEITFFSKNLLIMAALQDC